MTIFFTDWRHALGLLLILVHVFKNWGYVPSSHGLSKVHSKFQDDLFLCFLFLVHGCSNSSIVSLLIIFPSFTRIMCMMDASFLINIVFGVWGISELAAFWVSILSQKWCNSCDIFHRFFLRVYYFSFNVVPVLRAKWAIDWQRVLQDKTKVWQ